ncbi:DUF2312 domain-containing protein [Rhizobium bangladeshense]|uniref:DUF2312 domain-containing protein n=1 Tax=Rhizobium bangladeshense TaxID=1138189 RepID=UPI001C82C68E|nr:DUF2312 domain-containing protein [Rhizobium bangladeshense]MBX4870609.1 DUF2312 domain-containing protein [Rhizobium bangladeshense]MBX4872676.1 DUF2312 domain-containing protein [Rhizobium bangladeshense]
MTADKQLKAYIDRVLRLKEEQDALGQDIRDVYAEAKAEGYDKTIMGKLVAHLRRELKQGAGAVAEAESIFDTYLHAYQRASGMPVATHTHEEEFDPTTGEFVNEPVNAKLVATVATAMQTDIGRQALGAAVDIMIAREEAEEESRANVEEDAADESAAASDDPASRTSGESERQRSSMVGFADDCRTGGKEQLAAAAAPVGDADAEAHGIPVAYSEIAPASQGEAEAPSAERVGPEIHGSADANAGGEHVNAHSSAAKHTAGALVKPAPAKPLRPYCRNPGERCGGYGSTHCASCLKAAREAEVAA